MILLLSNPPSVASQSSFTVDVSPSSQSPIDCNPNGEVIISLPTQDTSIVLEYRLLYPDLVIGQWKFLLETAIDGRTSSMTQQLPADESGAIGVQIRVVQSRHGGSGCDCWALTSFRLQLDLSIGSADSQINPSDACYSELYDPVNNAFCTGVRYNTRGFITKAVYPTSIAGAECPGFSKFSLFDPAGHALPEDCDTSMPRM